MASDMNTVSSNLRAALISDFKDFYRTPDIAGLEGIDRIYTQDVELRDPIHAVNGRLALKNYLRGMYEGAHEMSFRYLDDQISEHTATITWVMRFSHGRLNGGKPIDVTGVTVIHFTDRIYYQEDFYDMGAMLYRHIPVLGSLIRFINKRLAA
ncbi:MAG: nuclear transport factor 2 family protein [Pseudohongiella sp.]|uniref:nuclear transport factor 2 family protein n=1 Tax=Pseudohongiella sp. TaxID=1979412 RepID=UPI0034A03EF2